MQESQIAAANRDYLRNFLGIIKGLDAHLKFVFLTGVSKFSKTSIFSGLNNLNDLSTDPIAASLVGYTEFELRKYFSDYLPKNGEITWDNLKKWYDGYRFSPDSDEKVYNPYSVTFCLSKQKIANYWFDSGTPSHLIPLLKADERALMGSNIEIRASEISSFDLEDIPAIALLYQSGYLTIEKAESMTYWLGYPNEEVRLSMAEHILPLIAHCEKKSAFAWVRDTKEALAQNDVGSFCQAVHSLCAKIPFQLHGASEAYYHSLVQSMAYVMGFDIRPEVSIATGRIDLVLHLPNRIFVIEIKFQKPASEALAQIYERQYDRAYQNGPKPVTLIGISFQKTKQNGFWIDYIQENLDTKTRSQGTTASTDSKFQ